VRAGGDERVIQDGSGAEVQKVEDELRTLREGLEELTSQTTAYETALDDLSHRRDELAGRLELSRRQAADFASRLALKEAELEEARKLAAYQAFSRAVDSRDAAATDAGRAIDAVIGGLELLTRLQDAVAAAGRAVPPPYDVSAVAPPEGFEAAWRRLVDVVRSRIDERLQDEAVEAAARSFQGYEINKLPEHLQAHARQLRASLTKRDSG
jgi:uncharacterized protein YlxW (UPF0749 family)